MDHKDMLQIEKRDDTPEINFNGVTGILNIKGRSFPQNAKKFYDPIFKWVDEYVKRAPRKTTIQLTLDYFHSSSQKAIVDILRKLHKIKEQNKELKVIWCYKENDEDMHDQGKEFQAYVNIPFEFKVCKD